MKTIKMSQFIQDNLYTISQTIFLPESDDEIEMAYQNNGSFELSLKTGENASSNRTMNFDFFSRDDVECFLDDIKRMLDFIDTDTSE